MVKGLFPYFLFFLVACQGPQKEVPFPESVNEFQDPEVKKIQLPPAKSANWIPSDKDSKHPDKIKVTYADFKDSVFGMDAFHPLNLPLDSHVIQREQLRSVSLSVKNLKRNKIQPSIILLGKPKKTKAEKPVVETEFTKGLLEFGQDQGLPGTEVHSITEDKLGRLWLSTDNGLCVYDGENIYTWYKRNGLSRDMKNNICIDKDGHIWAAGNGVDEIIPEQGIVRHYGKKEGLTSDRVVAVDMDSKGLLYFSEVEGVDVYDPQKQMVFHVGKEEGLSVALNINRVACDNEGKIWVASNCGGINVIDPESNKIFFLSETEGLGNNDCRSIVVDKDNKVWMGFWNGGVDCYDQKTGVLLHLKKKHGLKFNYVHELMLDKQGLVWISLLDYGLNVYDPQKRKIAYLYGKEGIVKSTVRCCYEDTEGRIWFGTTGAGLLRFDSYNGDIDNYSAKWWPTHLPILGIMEDKAGNFWLSTSGGGSCVYNPKKKTMREVNYGDNWTLAWQMDMQEDEKGNIYFGTGYNFVKFDVKNSVFTQWRKENGLPHGNVGSLHLHNDEVILGTGGGVDKLSLKESTFYHLGTKDDSLQMGISCFLPSANNKIWFGSYNKGLFCYDFVSSTLENYSAEQGFLSNYIYALAEDSLGRMWVGTEGNGIKVLHKKNKTVTSIDIANGLSEMTVTSLLISHSRVYAGTAKGLSVIDISDEKIKIKNYGKAQGFRTSAFSERAVMQAKDGSIWWGVGEMLTIYRPSVKVQAPHLPSITSVDIMKNEVRFVPPTNELSYVNASDTVWASARDTFYFKQHLEDQKNNTMSQQDLKWKSVAGVYQLPTELTLPYYKDHLTFHYTGNYTANADKSCYRYILEGLDNEWSPVTKESVVDYRNIPAGKYVFKVRSKNFGSEWSEAATFSFKVLPPWWKTKIAYTGYALMLIGIVYGYNRLRTKQLLKRQRELQNTVEERTKEVVEQKNEIARQKVTVEEKQKEIVDSINYARRIQFTLLAHDEVLKNFYDDHFVLFRPKDIVSGDFYWATRVENEKHSLFYLAVCDSTGHGVPGAFMSLLNISFLNEAITEKHIYQPDKILDYVRSRLIESISRDGAKDGMDGILLCFDRRNKRISYSAGNNAPVLCRENKLEELSFNKMPIGQGERNEQFSLFTVEAEKGSALYLYTDGFADQFGGPKGKKFKYRQLNELLLMNSGYAMNEQSRLLALALDNWKKDLEQVDDICVIGIRL